VKKVIYCSISLILFYYNIAIAQQKDLWVTFKKEDGLGDNSISAILESDDGTLWFATWGGGVSIYKDGAWTTYTTSNGLAANDVTSIYKASGEVMWFGTSGGGVSRYKNGKWTTFTTVDGLVYDDVYSICESNDGAMWFGTWYGVSRYKDGNWTTYTTTDGLIDNWVYSVYKSIDGGIWFGTGGGVSRYKDGYWTSYAPVDGLVGSTINTIYESKDGAMWFGSQVYGISRYKDGNWTNNESLTWIQSICESYDGAMWFGTREGVNRFKDGYWKTYTVTDGLSDNNVQSICESSDGALWFGTASGASMYISAIWKIFTEDDGLTFNMVYSISVSSDQSLWFGTWFGVSHFKDGNWTTYTTANGLANNSIYSIYESGDGALWIGTYEGGVCRYENGKLTSFTSADGLLDDDVMSIIESHDGSMWFGTLLGASRYKDGKWTKYTIDNGCPLYNVVSIYEAKDGAIWFGMYGSGLSRYADGNWTHYTTADGLVDNMVNAIRETSDGALWFGTSLGVSRYKDDHWQTYTTADGLSDDWVKSIFESRDGSLWFGTYRGGCSRYKDGIWTTISTIEGLSNNEVTSISETKDGFLWIGTRGGGVCRLLPDKSPPLTHIDKSPIDPIGSSTSVFAYGGKDYRTKDDQLYYSYAIVDTSRVPNDNDWSPFSKITYVETPPLQNNTYRFYVRAKDSWGNIDPTPATRIITVDITPPTVTINSPKPQDVVAGSFAIIGSAFDTSPIHDYKNYQLTYGYGNDRENITNWMTDRFSRIRSAEVRNDTLAIWYTDGLTNGSYWLQLSAWDTLGHESHDFVKVEVVKSSQFVDARKGSNMLAETGKIEVYIAPNAIPKDTQINIKDCLLSDVKPAEDKNISFTGLIFEISPSKTNLSKPGTLSVIYPDSLTSDTNNGQLTIYYSEDGKGAWQRLGGSIDKKESKITTAIDRLGVFGLYKDMTAGNSPGIFQVSSQPRIFSPQGGGHDTKTAISFELGKETAVTIKVYNGAGRLVRVLKDTELMQQGSNVVDWNGLDQRGETCLSGLYIVTIQTEKQTATKTVVVLNKY
jgi:ligand-binding sensor domain-containing protein